MSCLMRRGDGERTYVRTEGPDVQRLMISPARS